MKLFLKLFLLAFTIIGNSVYSQTLKNQNYLNLKIDTLNILPAIGQIGIPYKRQIISDDSLNYEFIDTLKSALYQTDFFKINLIANNNAIDEPGKKYISQLIPKIEKLSEEIFSIIPIGAELDSIISKQKGRYFAIICYNGFIQEKLGKKMAGSIAVGMGTAILTGGLFYATVVPNGSYLITSLLVIDKKNDCFLYYRWRYFNGSPFNLKKVKKNYDTVFSEM